MNASVKPKLSDRALFQIREWTEHSDQDSQVRRANWITQLKIAAIYGLFAALLAGYIATDGHWMLQALSIAALGLFAIPFLRVFMHSQSHWKVGNGPIRNFVLDHAVSILYSIQQTGFAHGHRAHHLYENDADPRGFPKDLQSTYIFSRDGKPVNIFAWSFFYLGIYQSAIQLFHTINTGKIRGAIAFGLESLLIAAFHAGVYRLSPGFYLGAYLPALALAWGVSASSLYMMHYVQQGRFVFYPALNSLNAFYNWFGDNNGYHIEHSLFPKLHPIFLKEANALVRPQKSQELRESYPIAALKLMFNYAYA